ncbi:MAG: HDOD domain-containing protein [Planctomycetota bacterium]|jgi:HD-like signal output (HDOD) protein
MTVLTENNESLRAMDDLIAAVEQLHSSPMVAYEVLRVLEDPNFEIRELVKLIETDPALAASIMRLVNSSFFSFPQKVASLQQAVTLLGARSLRLAVLGFGLIERLTGGAPAKVCRDYWRRALTMAVTASRVSDSDNTIPPDEAYMIGLLADVGVLVFTQVDTDPYVALFEQHDHGPALVEAEEEQYGFDHAALGARLLSQWRLTEALTTAVAGHHRDYPGGDPYHRAAFAGDLLADVLWIPQTPRMPVAQRFFQSELDLDVDGFISFVLDCRKDLTESAEVFQADVEEAIDCEEILRNAERQFKAAALENAIEHDSMTAWLEQDFT